MNHASVNIEQIDDGTRQRAVAIRLEAEKEAAVRFGSQREALQPGSAVRGEEQDWHRREQQQRREAVLEAERCH